MESKTKILKISNLEKSPHWDTLDKIMDERLKLGRNEKCFCGSEKKYKKCCLNSRPLQIIENFGFEVLKDEDGKIIVGVGESSNWMEGVSETHNPNEEPFDTTHHIDESEIKDYNSLWEITQSGWDTPKGDSSLYPFVNVNGEWWRWDNSLYLRPHCMTFKWTKENSQKYIGHIFTSQNKKDSEGIRVEYKDGRTIDFDYQPPNPMEVN